MNERFGRDRTVHFEETATGLVRGSISTREAAGEFYPQGAHVTAWTPQDSSPVLFTSARSFFAPGKAIRGGVPVIFPWFGARAGGLPGPAHGLARTRVWDVETIDVNGDGSEVESCAVTMRLQADNEARALGYAGFAVQYRVTMGSSLSLELVVTNESDLPLIYEAALHTYLAVGDVRRISVSGLEETDYIDKTNDFRRKVQPAEPLAITGETDRVYLNTTADCVVADPAGERRLIVSKAGSASTVVWNPWATKAAAMPDLAADEWTRFVCIESANVGENQVTLAPGGLHVMSATISIA